MTELALRELEKRGYAVFRKYNASDIGRARSIMATTALNDGFEYLMWIDSDMYFKADAVDQLLASGEPLIGAIYSIRGGLSHTSILMPGTREVIFGKGGGIIEVSALGTGFLMSHRDTYEAVRTQLTLPLCGIDGEVRVVPYFTHLITPRADKKGWHFFGEDYSYCYRARACGYIVKADTRIRVGHIGKYLYCWEDIDTQLERFDTYCYRVPKDERNCKPRQARPRDEN